MKVIYDQDTGVIKAWCSGAQDHKIVMTNYENVNWIDTDVEPTTHLESYSYSVNLDTLQVERTE